MIAVVSSTIKPSSENDKAISFYSFDERLQQTLLTLTHLEKCGFDEVFVVDNSPGLDQAQLQNILQDFPKVKKFHLLQYQFANKGITELMMLLYLAKYLPAGQNIFKISGRYYPLPDFVKPNFVDLAAKGYNYHSRTGTISTRAYWVKDSETFHRFLLSCLQEVFAYPERIVGVGSLLRQLFPRKNKTRRSLNISIEFAAANVIKSGGYQVSLLNNIGIEGLVAGADTYEKIIE